MGSSLASRATEPLFTRDFMTTRAGRTYKPTMEERTSAEHRTAEGSDHSGAATPPAAAIPEVGTIADVVRVMIEDRERREKEIAEERRRHDRERAEERRRYEEESERRIRDMTKQLELLREMVTARPIAAPIGAQRERES